MNYSKIFVGLFLAGLTMASCQKTEAEPVQEILEVPSPQFKVPSYMQALINYDDHGQQVIFCINVPSNCFPEFVLTASHSANIAEFDDAIDNDEVPYYFDNVSYIDLFPELEGFNDGEVVNDLISGDLVIHRYFQDYDQKTYYLIVPANIRIDYSEMSEWVNDVVATLVVVK